MYVFPLAWPGLACLPCPALPCPALPCPALPCPALPCIVLSCPVHTKLCLSQICTNLHKGVQSWKVLVQGRLRRSTASWSGLLSATARTTQRPLRHRTALTCCPLPSSCSTQMPTTPWLTRSSAWKTLSACASTRYSLTWSLFSVCANISCSFT